MLTLGAPALGAALLGIGADSLGFARVAMLTGVAGLVLILLCYARRERVLSAGSP